MTADTAKQGRALLLPDPTKSSNSLKKGTTKGAGAAGIGGGTLLVVIANSLKETNPLKPWLILAAPSVSVFLGVLWLWAQVKTLNLIRQHEERRAIRDAKRTIQEALRNSDTSEEHRKQIRAKLEELELVAVNRQLDIVRGLEINREEDPLAKQQRLVIETTAVEQIGSKTSHQFTRH